MLFKKHKFKNYIQFFFCLFLNILSIFSSPADQYFEKAKNASDVNEQIKLFSIALKLKPDFQDAIIGRAESYFNNNQLGKSEDDLKLFLEKFEPSARAFVLKGKIAQQNGLLDKAISFFDNALEFDSKYEEAILRKGILLVTFGNLKNRPNFYKEAIEYLSQIPQNSTFYELALLQKAKCHEYFQEYNEAEKTFEEICKIKKNISISFFNLARLQYMNENFTGANENLNKACELISQDRTFNVFYAAFRYYIQKQKLKDNISAEYSFNIFIDKLPSSNITKLYKKLITADEFLNIELSDEALKKVSKKRQASIKTETYCQAAYSFLIDNKITEAKELFQNAVSEELFGLNYYYLAKYELQRLKILDELL